jgi:hypothetical protein
LKIAPVEPPVILPKKLQVGHRSGKLKPLTFVGDPYGTHQNTAR